MTAELLHIEGLRTIFPAAGGEAAAVDGVSLRLGRGRTLGIVGESRLRQVRAVAVGDAPGAAARRASARGPSGSTAHDLLTLPEARMRAHPRQAASP